MELISVHDLQPAAYNPRKADAKRLDMVELSLRKLGFILPIYATRDGEIISGHQRHLVAMRMGATSVPVVYIPDMTLAERKGMNIAFNRGTNDLDAHHTPESLGREMASKQVNQLAARIPDKDVGSREFVRCMDAKLVSVPSLVKANKGRWVDHAALVASTLRRQGVTMPVVITKDGTVINGIGRLQLAARNKEAHIEAVEISDDEAEFAAAMLNKLSMDFDLHGRYRDMLRHNSFRRLRRSRATLGIGFIFATHGGTSKSHNINDPRTRERWIKEHGSVVLDFGAGHLTETEMLRKIGVKVTPFEPYRTGKGDVIDKAESMRVVDEFLRDVARGVRYTSAFIASVLNSVPFAEDRRHIICLVSALCLPAARLYIAAPSIMPQYLQTLGKSFQNKDSLNGRLFRLDYEPGITIGDMTSSPKVQKYHTPEEMYGLLKEFFEVARVHNRGGTLCAIAEKPRPVDVDKLRAAIEFEFDLPYPDDTRMGRVDEAKRAFSKRLGVTL